MTNDIKMHKLYSAIAVTLKTQIEDSADVDGDVFAEIFDIQQLAILQKEIAKAISRKVLG
jgi:TATA-binding protein-associated factor Taf7